MWDSRVAGRPVGVSGTSVLVAGGSVPATARAVVVNLTTVDASASGLPLLSWAAGTARPTTSNGNTIKGAAVATQVVVGVGSGGRISLATGGGTSHVVVDVVGYVVMSSVLSSAVDGEVRTIAPLRLADTRTTGTPLASGQRLVRQVTGRGGVPKSASAALVTITSVPGTTSTGTLVAVGNGERRPPTSDVNARTDVPVARQVITPLGVDGGVAVHPCAAARDTSSLDLVGYVTAVPRARRRRRPTSTCSGDGARRAAGSQAAPVLSSSVRYGLTHLVARHRTELLAKPMDPRRSVTGTDAVRRLSMEALGVSTALATGVYDAAEPACPRTQALDVVRSDRRPGGLPAPGERDRGLGAVLAEHDVVVAGGAGRWLSWDDAAVVDPRLRAFDGRSRRPTSPRPSNR